MRNLDSKEYKEFVALQKKDKDGKCTEQEKARLAELRAKKNAKGSNDLQWWNNYPELLKDVVNFPFNWIPGTTVHYGSDELKLGLLAIAKVAPGFGHSTSDADAYNAQIRQLWLDLHRKYRGIGTYEKSDLGIAIAAIASVFETIAKFERIYGVINTYHIGNRVVPNGLMDALRVDTNLPDELADFRYNLNLAIEKCRQLCLPKGLSAIISDVISMSNIFKDSSNKRAFLFAFDAEEFGIYSPTTFTSGGAVLYYNYMDYGFITGSTPSGYSGFTLSDIIATLNAQINALLSDDDIARICSDLLAAYGEGNVMVLSSVPEDYKVEPVHDYERQLQFHNMTICGDTSSIVENINNVITIANLQSEQNSGMRHVLYQDNNIMKYRVSKGTGQYAVYGTEAWPKFNSSDVYIPLTGDVLFDTWVDAPGATELMCGTRYTSIAGAPYIIDSSFSRQEVDIFGTKIVEEVTIYAYTGTSYTRDQLLGTYVTETGFKNNIYAFARLVQMDWHPMFYIVDSGDFELFGDVDNFTMISRNNLSRLHEVALLSGYKCDVTPKE